MIEFAIVFPLVITIVLAIAEFSLGFKDWLTVSNAARESVRVASIAGDDVHSDIEALRALERAMVTERMGSLVSVTIGNPDSATEHTVYIWDADSTCHWTPCPDPSDASYTQPVWKPASRKVSIPTDRVEVTVSFRHVWLTGLFTHGPTTWTKTVVMDIEPQTF
jgi:hypothetical protein